MRRVARLAALVLVILLLIPLAIGLASELGGEVVVLHTRGDGGEARETRLWVVDDAGRAWLRSGRADSAWYRRLEARPDVEVTRGGVTRAYRAVPVPQVRDRINGLMAEKYGWADALIDLVRDSAGAVPVRLEPGTPPQSQSSP